MIYAIQSRVCNIVTFLYKKWYPKGSKVIPFTLLDKYFNKQSLAWWYMDDGHLKINNNIPEKIILSTEGFTDLEIDKLVHFLNKKYTLVFSIDTQRRIILYDQYQIFYFLHLVKPYLHYSMFRKIYHVSQLVQPINARRTTLYLPNAINIQQPTKQINKALRKLATLIRHFKNESFYKLHKANYPTNKKQNSYQIIINEQNIANLTFLKQNTGLSFSQLTHLCFKL